MDKYKEIESELIDCVDTDFITKHLVKCKTIDILIIKGHLVIEHSINEFINKNALIDNNISKSRFSFYDKIEISKLFGLFSWNDKLENQLKSFNKLRNSLAHSLNYNSDLLDDFINSIDKDVFNKILKQIYTDDEIIISNQKGEKYMIEKDFLPLSIAISYIFGVISVCSMEKIIKKIRQTN